MKDYKKCILSILTIFILSSITGCSSITSYQQSIFDDDNKITKEEDSYTYKIREGKGAGNEIDITFTSFTGMDTVYKFMAEEEGEVTFHFESVVHKGDFKVVLITPEKEVINILSDTEKGDKIIPLGEGESRMKLVGKKAKGTMKMTMDVEEKIKMKRQD
ncbi:hypothetical protein NSA47_06175 [Irregularibacter muris]|uniref:Lipoprotein n=1 Tax=Irregularibacter muris TaxID=1796619 RepID=A0AAE3L3N8_9FIRM|nr:hypothetical protein [Irregularibacter muris]MCR1898578.1 hypothetical protein [Irregularibacter muris]